jgi:peptidoglycan/LPS O-acetylase OafA/YrhL
LSTAILLNHLPAARAQTGGHELVRPQRMGHIAALDGLRGFAFLLVYVQHFTGGNHIHLRAVEAFRGIGWTGVDLFFCLSGFLITGILYDTREDPRYFRNFYGRRAVRIFPLYYLCLLAIFALTPWLHLEWHLYHLAYPLYGSNFLNALLPRVNTFGFEPWIDLGHFWSLAVEEQFYLVWPVLVLLCGTRQRIVRLCVGMTLGSLVLRAAFVALYLHGVPLAAGAMPAAFFYKTFLYRITFFRLDALALGGVAAMLWRTEEFASWFRYIQWAVVPLLAATAVTLGFSFHLETPLTAVFGYTLLAMLYGALILLTAHGKLMGSVFGVGWLRAIGRYSYAMYLLHQIVRPAMPFLIRRLAPLVGSVAVTAVICSVAWFGCLYLLAKVSFVLFESRFLGLKRYFAYTGVSQATG